MARVVNIRDGFPPAGVYIGRAGRGFDGRFGNPFQVGRDGDRAAVIHRYEEYFRRRLADDPEFWYDVRALVGKTLVCFCKPLSCHGDVIVKYLNERYGDPIS